MFIIHWLGSPWNVGIITLRGWAWVLIIAAVALAAGLGMYAVVFGRRLEREADKEIGEAFREADSESGTTATARQANPDDLYAARPPVTGPPGPGLAIGSNGHAGDDRGGPPVARRPVSSWENWPELAARADALQARAADPATFNAWLEDDRADYQRDVDRIDRILATGVWASTPWLERQAA